MSTSRNEFMVAIELGSSKLIAMAGYMQPDGNLDVLAVKEIPSTDFMLYGAVHNLEKTKNSLKEAIDYLQDTLQKRITKAYVAIECQGMHSEVVHKYLEYSTDTITQEMVQQMQSEAKATHAHHMMTHHSYPIEYRVGGQVLNGEPVGVLGDSIEGKYINIVTRRGIFENLERSFNDTGLEDVSFRIGTRALRTAVLAESETRSNCLLVDLGAQLTTVAIYNKSKLHHLAVLPLGSSHITKDLMTLGIDEVEAEKLKRTYGVAYSETPLEDSADKDVVLPDGRVIKQSLVIEIVEARVQEILVNVREQMRMNHYRAEDLLGGVIVTGGGSNMARIREAMTHYLGIDKVRIATQPLFGVVGQVPANLEKGTYNTILGLIKRAKDNCCGGDLKAPAPATDLFEAADEPVVEEVLSEEGPKAPKADIEGEEKMVEEAPATIQPAPTALPAGDDEEDEPTEKKASWWKRTTNFFKQSFGSAQLEDDEEV